MKKLALLILLVILSGCTPSFAKNVKVMAMSDFSTANPPKTWRVKILEPFTTKSGYEVFEGSIITGQITDVTDPKRLKRNASFKFIPMSYYDAKTNKTFHVEKDYVGKYNSLGDITAGEVIEKGAITAGNYFINSTIGTGVALVKGAVKNENGNRVKSAAVSVYESTPISYIGKGKELEIKTGQTFLMNFKLKDEDEFEDED